MNRSILAALRLESDRRAREMADAPLLRECGCSIRVECPRHGDAAPTPEAIERVARFLMAQFDDPIGMKSKREWREMARAALPTPEAVERVIEAVKEWGALRESGTNQEIVEAWQAVLAALGSVAGGGVSGAPVV